jgi:hypothetical protein
LGVVIAVKSGGNPLGGALSGAIIAVAIDMFMQVTVGKTAIENIDTTSLLVSAITGAVAGAIGSGIGAGAVAIKESTKHIAIKIIASIGLAFGAAAGGFVTGSISYLLNATTRDQEIVFDDYIKAASLGAIVGVVALGVSSVASAVVGIESASTAAYLIAQSVSGAVIGFANYMLAVAILGQEFNWQDMLLSIGISAAVSLAFAVGTKTYYNKQMASEARKQGSTNKATVDDSSDDYAAIKKAMTTDDGLEDLIKKYPDKATGWKKAIDKYNEVADSPDVTPAELENAAKAVKMIKGKVLEEATKDMLVKKGFNVQQNQELVSGTKGNTYPDVVATNNTGKTIKVFGQNVKNGETIIIECKAGKTSYIKGELGEHIPKQLAGHGKARSVLLTTNDSDGIDPAYINMKLSDTNSTHVRLDISADDINNALLNYGG